MLLARERYPCECHPNTMYGRVLKKKCLSTLNQFLANGKMRKSIPPATTSQRSYVTLHYFFIIECVCQFWTAWGSNLLCSCDPPSCKLTNCHVCIVYHVRIKQMSSSLMCWIAWFKCSFILKDWKLFNDDSSLTARPHGRQRDAKDPNLWDNKNKLCG